MLTSNEHIALFRTTTNSDLCDVLRSLWLFSLTRAKKKAANINATERNTLPVLYTIHSSTVIYYYSINIIYIYIKGIKMFPSKASRDVEMVDGVSDATGSCMENQLVENVQEQGGLFRDYNNRVNICCLQDTLWIHFHHPYIWQHFDAALPSWPRQ